MQITSVHLRQPDLNRMAKNEQIAKEQVATQVSRHLSQTRYACSSLTRVSGGSVNFVFRGVLVHPLLGAMGAIAARTIIVKHSAASLASNRDFLLDVSRCVTLSPPPPQKERKKEKRLSSLTAPEDKRVHSMAHAEY